MRRVLDWLCVLLVVACWCGTAMAQPGQSHPLIWDTEAWILWNEGGESNLSNLWIRQNWTSDVDTAVTWCDNDADPAWPDSERGIFLYDSSIPANVHGVPFTAYHSGTARSGTVDRSTDWHDLYNDGEYIQAQCRCHWHSTGNSPSSGASFEWEEVPRVWTTTSPACALSVTEADYCGSPGSWDQFNLKGIRMTWNFIHETLHNYTTKNLYIVYTDKDNAPHWVLLEELPGKHRMEYDKERFFAQVLWASQRPADKVWHCELVIGRDPTLVSPNGEKHVSCAFTVTVP